MDQANIPYTYCDGRSIAAIATATGQCALSLIRTSGPDALALLEKAFSRPAALRAAAGNTMVYGWIVDGGEKIDETMVSVYRAPKSYTGEDGADICCHGGSAAPKAVLKTLLKAGFREALPGEFSLRAFANGKIDLTRAESIMEIVQSKTDKGRKSSISRLCGALEDEIRSIQDTLVQILAEIELLLDYSELDGVGTPDENTLAPPAAHSLAAAQKRLAALAESYRAEKLYREGALIVISGRPNAGKSSLFNLLLKEDRALVSDIPGTTRDWIEDTLAIAGIPIRLADTAGLRESSETLEKLGIERSRALATEADLLLYVIDGEAATRQNTLHEDDRAFLQAASASETLVLWNKADKGGEPPPSLQTFGFLLPPPAGVPPATPPSSFECIATSAKTGRGIPQLCDAIGRRLAAAAGTIETSLPAAIGSERQKNLVESAHAALAETLTMASDKMPLDLIAPRLREAINALGEITGEVSTADILEAMFSRFCVGK